jgi:hypothetical protein
MPHNAEDVIEQLDWEEWPDFELFERTGEDTAAPPDEDAA